MPLQRVFRRHGHVAKNAKAKGVEGFRSDALDPAALDEIMVYYVNRRKKEWSS